MNFYGRIFISTSMSSINQEAESLSGITAVSDRRTTPHRPPDHAHRSRRLKVAQRELRPSSIEYLAMKLMCVLFVVGTLLSVYTVAEVKRRCRCVPDQWSGLLISREISAKVCTARGVRVYACVRVRMCIFGTCS